MARTERAVFRLPLVSLLIPLVMLILVIPLATVGRWWAVLFVLPLLGLAYVALTWTVADRAGMRTRTLRGGQRMSWDELDGLEFREASWAVAVAHDGRRVRLPMVRPRDLPRLAAASGGYLDLAGETVDPQPDQEPAPEPAAQNAGTPEAAATETAPGDATTPSDRAE